MSSRKSYAKMQSACAQQNSNDVSRMALDDGVDEDEFLEQAMDAQMQLQSASRLVNVVINQGSSRKLDREQPLGREIDHEVKLEWGNGDDLDLHVLNDLTGEHVSFGERNKEETVTYDGKSSPWKQRMDETFGESEKIKQFKQLKTRLILDVNAGGTSFPRNQDHDAYLADDVYAMRPRYMPQGTQWENTIPVEDIFVTNKAAGKFRYAVNLYSKKHRGPMATPYNLEVRLYDSDGTAVADPEQPLKKVDFMFPNECKGTVTQCIADTLKNVQGKNGTPVPKPFFDEANSECQTEEDHCFKVDEVAVGVFDDQQPKYFGGAYATKEFLEKLFAKGAIVKPLVFYTEPISAIKQKRNFDPKGMTTTLHVQGPPTVNPIRAKLKFYSTVPLNKGGIDSVLDAVTVEKDPVSGKFEVVFDDKLLKWRPEESLNYFKTRKVTDQKLNKSKDQLLDEFLTFRARSTSTTESPSPNCVQDGGSNLRAGSKAGSSTSGSSTSYEWKKNQHNVVGFCDGDTVVPKKFLNMFGSDKIVPGQVISASSWEQLSRRDQPASFDKAKGTMRNLKLAETKLLENSSEETTTTTWKDQRNLEPSKSTDVGSNWLPIPPKHMQATLNLEARKFYAGNPMEVKFTPTHSSKPITPIYPNRPDQYCSDFDTRCGNGWKVKKNASRILLPNGRGDFDREKCCDKVVGIPNDPNGGAYPCGLSGGCFFVLLVGGTAVVVVLLTLFVLFVAGFFRRKNQESANAHSDEDQDEKKKTDASDESGSSFASSSSSSSASDDVHQENEVLKVVDGVPATM